MFVTDKLYRITPLPQQRLWGTQRLSEQFKPQPSGDPYGEIFLCSAMTEADSLIDGIPFSQFYTQNRSAFFGISPRVFPLRVNLIESAQALSIQVHPDKRTTAAMGFPQGVHEGWFILDHEAESEIVLGHNAPDADHLKNAIQQGILNNVLVSTLVHNGDFFYLPPGTVHAIGKGFRVYELTYNLDITYRVYDYDRIQASTGRKRQLHIDEALDVITFPQKPETVLAHAEDQSSKADVKVLFDRCGVFSLEAWTIQGSASLSIYQFYLVTVVEGEGSLNKIPVKAYDTLLVPSNCPRLEIEGTLKILAASYREER